MNSLSEVYIVAQKYKKGVESFAVSAEFCIFVRYCLVTMPCIRYISVLAGVLFAFLSIVRNNASEVISADEVSHNSMEVVQAQDNSAAIQLARKANYLFRTPSTVTSVWSGRPTVTPDFGSASYASAVFDGRMSCAALLTACRRVESRRHIDRNVVLHNLRL